MCISMKRMGRTNVEIDEKVIGRVMKLYGLRTKREAIDFALRRVAGGYDPKAMRELEGIGWDGDLKEMRRTRNLEW